MVPMAVVNTEVGVVVHHVLLLSSMLWIGVACLPWPSSLTQ